MSCGQGIPDIKIAYPFINNKVIQRIEGDNFKRIYAMTKNCLYRRCGQFFI